MSEPTDLLSHNAATGGRWLNADEIEKQCILRAALANENDIYAIMSSYVMNENNTLTVYVTILHKNLSVTQLRSHYTSAIEVTPLPQEDTNMSELQRNGSPFDDGRSHWADELERPQMEYDNPNGVAGDHDSDDDPDYSDDDTSDEDIEAELDDEDQDADLADELDSEPESDDAAD